MFRILVLVLLLTLIPFAAFSQSGAAAEPEEAGPWAGKGSLGYLVPDRKQTST